MIIFVSGIGYESDIGIEAVTACVLPGIKSEADLQEYKIKLGFDEPPKCVVATLAIAEEQAVGDVLFRDQGFKKLFEQLLAEAFRAGERHEALHHI